jgi:hypothetical protein
MPQLTKKIVRNAESSNPKKNPAMRRRFHQAQPVQYAVPVIRDAMPAQRPRLRGALSKIAPFDVTTFQQIAHTANKASSRPKHSGSFGGVSRTLRAELKKQREQEPAAKQAA